MNTDVFEKHGRRRRSRGGWSLIEVIATIVLSAVLVTLLLPLINSGLVGSQRGLLRMPATYGLRTDLDDWWQRHRAEFIDDLPGLYDEIPDAPGVEKTWVEFNAAGDEIVTGVNTDTLRVTLTNAQGERLTAYFFPIP